TALGTRGTRATEAALPRPRSSRKRRQPSAAPWPKEEPPVRRMPCTAPPRTPGRSASAWRSEAPPPPTSTPPIAWPSKRTTVQPVPAARSVACPTRTPGTSVMEVRASSTGRSRGAGAPPPVGARGRPTGSPAPIGGLQPACGRPGRGPGGVAGRRGAHREDELARDLLHRRVERLGGGLLRPRLGAGRPLVEVEAAHLAGEDDLAPLLGEGERGDERRPERSLLARADHLDAAVAQRLGEEVARALHQRRLDGARDRRGLGDGRPLRESGGGKREKREGEEVAHGELRNPSSDGGRKGG